MKTFDSHELGYYIPQLAQMVIKQDFQHSYPDLQDDCVFIMTPEGFQVQSNKLPYKDLYARIFDLKSVKQYLALEDHWSAYLTYDVDKVLQLLEAAERFQQFVIHSAQRISVDEIGYKPEHESEIKCILAQFALANPELIYL